ncbi:DUF2621 domain-containing protein [Alicyclobacillus sp. SO9]|nr:DUF2621 domain-containing protein [Alicyclobacillus sp. SO9]
MSSWIMIAMIVVNSILVILFLGGAFFMTRAFLRKMKNNS